MKHLINIITFSLITSFCFAQSNKLQFEQFLREGDTVKQFEQLVKWEKDNPEDPELITSYFNYYFLKSQQEVLKVSTNKPDGESLILEDSTGKTAGYLGSDIIYNQDILQKGFDKIDEGIKLFPNRLDMRFGKVHVMGLIRDWTRFTKEIITTIRYSSLNNNQWTWTDNEKLDDGKNTFLSSLQDYQLTLYDTGDDNLLINMREIAEEVLKVYPDHIESLSNISVTYLLTGEYDKGIEILLKAEKLNPQDIIILSNIAQGYKLKGENDNAITYYEKILKLDDSQAVKFAKEEIEKLKVK